MNGPDTSGWILMPSQANGTWGLYHSNGFFVAGFASAANALNWLLSYVLGQQRNLLAQEERLARAQLEVLAQLPAHGRVS